MINNKTNIIGPCYNYYFTNNFLFKRNEIIACKLYGVNKIFVNPKHKSSLKDCFITPVSYKDINQIKWEYITLLNKISYIFTNGHFIPESDFNYIKQLGLYVDNKFINYCLNTDYISCLKAINTHRKRYNNGDHDIVFYDGIWPKLIKDTIHEPRFDNIF